MCLDTIERTIDNPSDEVTEAWKFVVSSTKGIYQFPYYPKGSFHIPTHKWLEADAYRISVSPQKSYFSGFHCFANPEDAKLMGKYRSSKYEIIKVLVRKIRTHGTEYLNAIPLVVIVADEMFVPDQETTE